MFDAKTIDVFTKIVENQGLLGVIILAGIGFIWKYWIPQWQAEQAARRAQEAALVERMEKQAAEHQAERKEIRQEHRQDIEKQQMGFNRMLETFREGLERNTAALEKNTAATVNGFERIERKKGAD